MATRGLDRYTHASFEAAKGLVNNGGNAAYQEAEKRVTRVAGLRSKVEQAAYVADFRARHRRKRNFMKVLG